MTELSTPLPLVADRDSVCAGDDCESHDRAFAAPLHATVANLIDLATAACPLASISGGRATWIVEAGGYGGRPIAVVAQQWQVPRLLAAVSETVDSLFRQSEPVVYFRYWCQADPQAVFDALATGAPLPARYG